MIDPDAPGGLTWREVPDPAPGPGEVLLDVIAAGVNRADLMQVAGHHPPPAGTPAYPGLECSGTVAALGDGAAGPEVGTAVLALLSGGGYAERVVVPAGQLLELPDGADPVAAGGVMEAACTVWSNVYETGRLAPGEVLLVHGGTSGVGTTAIAMARASGCPVYATAGTPEKVARARELGADGVFDYREQDWVAGVRDATGGRGADVVLDVVGGSYLGRNVDVLAPDGRIACIAFPGGATGTLDLAKLLAVRGSVAASGLRNRPAAQKAAIVAGVGPAVLPLVADGTVPVVDRVLPMSRAAEAHRALADGGVVGKVVLTPG